VSAAVFTLVIEFMPAISLVPLELEVAWVDPMYGNANGWTWSALAAVVAVPTAAVPFAPGVVELSPVMLLNEVPVATPIFGVVSWGLVANTRAPDPVSSEITPAS
jgi:hypothetical protein